MKGSLRFRADGSFTIVQFTDLHFENGGEEDHYTATLMAQVLEAERPCTADPRQAGAEQMQSPPPET